MTSRPGFRRTSTGGRDAVGRPDDDDAGRPALTTPFSQAQILHLMKSEFARARRHGYPLACILVRADRLDSLAELHGEELRAVVRQRLVAVIDQTTRGHDHLGFVGEDSFLVVLPHSEAEAARVVGERLRQQFAGLEVVVDGAPLSLTLSVGIAACADKDTLFFDTLLSQAEVALEWAVREGGDEVILFQRDRFVDPDFEAPS